MMLPVCSAAPTSTSHFQLSFHAGSRGFYQLRKAIEDVRIIEGRTFCSQDGIHAQDVSFKAHAARLMHSLVVEHPDKSGAADSSIFSPYPNEFDDIVRGLPNEVTDNPPENLSCLVGEGNRLYPLAGDLKYMGSSEASGAKLRNGQLVTEITNGHELQNFANSIPESLNSLSESTASGSPLFTNEVTSVASDNPTEITNTFNLPNEGPLNPKESIDKFLSGVTESIDTSVVKANGALKGSYDTLVSSYTDAVKRLTESFDNAVSGFFSSSGDSREQAGISTTIKENLYKTGSLATDILRRVIIIVEDSVSNAATLVVYSYGSAKSLLPSDLKNALNVSEEKAFEILKPVGAAIQQIYIIIEGFEKNLGLDPSDPIVPFLLLVGSSTTVGVSYWFLRYGGYSGDLTPEVTLELLKNDKNAVLIDVRPEDLRARDGIPDLRRAARPKYASVTLPELDGSMKKQVKGGKGIDDALIAVVIRNLKLVNENSKVIVMDDTGTSSKSIARSLKKFGVKNTFMIEGGFKSWIREGLPVKDLKPETAFSVLNEEAEAIIQEIKPTPTLVIGYGLGSLVACYALLEWERTLQLIGIFGLAQTLYRRFASYEGSQDFKQDVRLLLTPVSIGAQAVSWAAGKLEPNKIGLPTTPSSTAVQDRVLKAAAKHESQPSDADDSQGLPTEASGQANENLDLSEA